MFPLYVRYEGKLLIDANVAEKFYLTKTYRIGCRQSLANMSQSLLLRQPDVFFKPYWLYGI